MSTRFGSVVGLADRGFMPDVCESAGAIGTGFFAIGRGFSSAGRFWVGGVVGDW